ncbi:alpha-amylase family protein [Ornithinimicrobium pekingense]|uniref:Alpha-amylase n=1 Tax=Ornithinimicrobium pekingense TaxID=384677 RepID=A0ABQ2FDV7_9MICO|nr:alpha-amylase family protein [Ornithinimicrobium pekingense]GGK77944.1 alpha-amylase [Ornithinimicrobium pekingense]
MRITDTSDLWWKSAVIYCLDVETFLDADGDGVGDLEGLAQRIDYLADLGITCLWLMPFYPSPDRDDGYDIKDYLSVDERLGDLGRMVEILRLAHDRGMRVVADLVVNHTSDQHPWFKRSRAEKDPAKNPYRDYYVWRADDPGDTSDQVVFPDKEDSIWTKDDKTGEWYLHHFYRHQPDLNLDHPEVVAELLRAVGFWLELGFDGFRVDGVPFFAQEPGKEGEDDVVDPHAFMKKLRDFIQLRRGDAMTLGEVNLPHEQQLAFFGGESADEFHMQFDFIGMQATYLSMARQDARPLVKALQERPVLHRTNQWATFLRNHDELTLDKLTDSERQEVFDAFGPEKRMQVYDRGLKRRLPTMMGGDPRRVRMAYSLMFSLPGTPTLYYGEEIGMGEDLAAEGRMAVRTPMQWSATKNGGFSSAQPSRLVQAVVGDGYGPEHVNVMDQLHDPDSLLSWIRQLIKLRHACPELGWGELQILEHDAGPAVLAHRLSLESTAIIAMHNLGADPVTVTVPADGFGDEPRVVDLLTHDVLEPGTEVECALEGYGVRWLRVRPTGDLAVP